MTIKKKEIVVFDFDGTLTTSDTLLLFIRFAVGTPRFIFGIALFLPLIVLMKLHLYDNSRCKEKVFSYFFRGMSYERFAELGRHFRPKASEVARLETTRALAEHRESGARIYVISASIEEWVRPYCESLGVHDVLATKVETDSKGNLTGRFASANCYGEEKVRRLLAVEPERETYHLTAYGDSAGDAEMFALADKKIKV